MAFFPKIEKITFNATVSHFVLMFGYKLFSLYFPLFLVMRGLSFPEVGYTYLLIYLPLAFSAPLVGFLTYRVNAGILAVLGILGYSVYSLGMIFLQPSIFFYLLQIFLGISASFFFVSTRAILMSSDLENPNRAFGWFYSAPYYADALGPVVGALFIWRFGFLGVFGASVVLQFFNAIFTLFQLKKQSLLVRWRPDSEKPGLAAFLRAYRAAFEKLKQRRTFSPLIVCFTVLFVGGFYRAFFVLFLKELGWTQNSILFFVSLLSLVFLPLSFFIIKRIEQLRSEKNIFQGATITGALSILMGLVAGFSGFLSIFLIKLSEAVAGLMSGAGRSGLLTQRLKEQPEEASAIDTVFSPLGASLGSLVSGLIIGFLGFANLFILGGVLVLAVAFIAKKVSGKAPPLPPH